MTAVHCDNDRCKHNEDRLCTRADMYCVGRRCRSERHMTYIDLMRGRDPCPYKNAIRSARRRHFRGGHQKSPGKYFDMCNTKRQRKRKTFFHLEIIVDKINKIGYNKSMKGGTI